MALVQIMVLALIGYVTLSSLLNLSQSLGGKKGRGNYTLSECYEN